MERKNKNKKKPKKTKTKTKKTKKTLSVNFREYILVNLGDAMQPRRQNVTISAPKYTM